MNKLYLECLLLIILTSCSVTKNKVDSKKNYSEIISENFKDTDSLSIEIIYRELSGCTDLQIGKINITQANDEMFFFHLSADENHEVEYFSGTSNGLIDLIVDLESESKKMNSGCGGISGGTGCSIDMKINTQETKFGFCKDKYDGINKLIDQIRVLKQKS